MHLQFQIHSPGSIKKVGTSPLKTQPINIFHIQLRQCQHCRKCWHRLHLLSSLLLNRLPIRSNNEREGLKTLPLKPKEPQIIELHLTLKAQLSVRFRLCRRAGDNNFPRGSRCASWIGSLAFHLPGFSGNSRKGFTGTSLQDIAPAMTACRVFKHGTPFG